MLSYDPQLLVDERNAVGGVVVAGFSNITSVFFNLWITFQIMRTKLQRTTVGKRRAYQWRFSRFWKTRNFPRGARVVKSTLSLESCPARFEDGRGPVLCAPAEKIMGGKRGREKKLWSRLGKIHWKGHQRKNTMSSLSVSIPYPVEDVGFILSKTEDRQNKVRYRIIL